MAVVYPQIRCAATYLNHLVFGSPRATLDGYPRNAE